MERHGELIFISRQQLLDRVWQSNLGSIASELDVDPSELKRIVREFQVPLPPPGYWKKIEFNKPLPDRPELPTTAHRAKPRLRSNWSIREAASREAAKLRDERLPLVAKLLSNTRTRRHPAVTELRARREDGLFYANGAVRSALSGFISQGEERAFVAFNRLAWYFSNQGWQVEVSEATAGSFHLANSGEQVQVRLRERLTQSFRPIKLSADPLLRRMEMSSGRKREQTFEPSGIVECNVEGRKWSEDKGRSIEELLPDICLVIEDLMRGKINQARLRTERSELNRQLAERRKQRELDAERLDRLWQTAVEVAKVREEAKLVGAMLDEITSEDTDAGSSLSEKVILLLRQLQQERSWKITRLQSVAEGFVRRR